MSRPARHWSMVSKAARRGANSSKLRIKNLTKRGTGLLFGIGIVVALVATVSLFYVGTSHLSAGTKIGFGSGNVEGLTNSTTIFQQPSVMPNGTTPIFAPQCANFSQMYTPLASSGGIVTTVSTVAGSPSPTTDVGSVIVTVLCNDCGGATTSDQWAGTFGPIDSGTTTASVSGICDSRFLAENFNTSPWHFTWSFQRLSTVGTLEIKITLSNQTVLYDRSISASATSLSGALDFPGQ